MSLRYTSAHLLLEDFRAKTLESDIFKRLIKLLQGSNSDAQGWLINVLAQFGIHLYFMIYNCSSFIR